MGTTTNTILVWSVRLNSSVSKTSKINFKPNGPHSGEQHEITVIAGRLQRDRSAVKRDVDQLARVGLVTVETKVLPGHGHMKEVRAAAGQFRLEAMVM